MTETVTQRADAIHKLLEAHVDETDQVKEAALAAMSAPIPSPASTDVGHLWKALVYGLLILIGLSIVGVLWAVLDAKSSTDAKTVLLVFTPLVTGLFGLFVSSPTQGG